MIRKGIEDITHINLAPGGTVRIDTSDWAVDTLAVCVTSGVLDLFKGEGIITGAPQYRFRAGEPVAWIPVVVCGERYVVTLLSSGLDQCIATVTLITKVKENYRG